MKYDKTVHLLGSLIVCLILSYAMSLDYAVIITVVLGITKELIYDWVMKKGTPEIGDLIADAFGIALAVAIKSL